MSIFQADTMQPGTLKTLAKALQRATLTVTGQPQPLNQSQEILARTFHHPNWHAALETTARNAKPTSSPSTAAGGAPSLDDLLAQLRQRLPAHQHALLAELGGSAPDPEVETHFQGLGLHVPHGLRFQPKLGAWVRPQKRPNPQDHFHAIFLRCLVLLTAAGLTLREALTALNERLVGPLRSPSMVLFMLVHQMAECALDRLNDLPADRSSDVRGLIEAMIGFHIGSQDSWTGHLHRTLQREGLNALVPAETPLSETLQRLVGALDGDLIPPHEHAWVGTLIADLATRLNRPFAPALTLRCELEQLSLSRPFAFKEHQEDAQSLIDRLRQPHKGASMAHLAACVDPFHGRLSLGLHVLALLCQHRTGLGQHQVSLGDDEGLGLLLRDGWEVRAGEPQPPVTPKEKREEIALPKAERANDRETMGPDQVHALFLRCAMIGHQAHLTLAETMAALRDLSLPTDPRARDLMRQMQIFAGRFQPLRRIAPISAPGIFWPSVSMPSPTPAPRPPTPTS